MVEQSETGVQFQRAPLLDGVTPGVHIAWVGAGRE